MNHVAFLIPTLDRISGAERQVILLAGSLVKRQWRVSVIALSGTGGDTAGELHNAGATFMSLGMRKGLADPRGWFRFNRWLNRQRPDIVHAHLPHAAWLARLSRPAAPTRVLLDSIHSSFTGSFGRKLGYRLTKWLPDAVTCVSPSAALPWRSSEMVLAQNLTVIPNGVDTKLWKPDRAVRKKMRDILGLRDEFLWFAAGRLDPVKDYPTLLRAMIRLPRSARLVIAGSGPLEMELRHLASDLSLDERVSFLGFVPDVLPWMQAADGFVLTSRWEGLPIALLEASSCALPAVATNVPGITDVITDSQNGILVRECDSRDLADAMARLMQMPPAARNSLGESARQAVIQRFSLEPVLDRWEELYLELLIRSPRPRRRGNDHVRTHLFAHRSTT
jgi:glycosyltransferase involved in cell wall biosynthesis